MNDFAKFKDLISKGAVVILHPDDLREIRERPESDLLDALEYALGPDLTRVPFVSSVQAERGKMSAVMLDRAGVMDSTEWDVGVDMASGWQGKENL